MSKLELSRRSIAHRVNRQVRDYLVEDVPRLQARPRHGRGAFDRIVGIEADSLTSIITDRPSVNARVICMDPYGGLSSAESHWPPRSRTTAYNLAQ